MDTLIVVMVSQVYTYVQIHQNVYTKYVQLFVYQLYFNKAKNIMDTFRVFYYKLLVSYLYFHLLIFIVHLMYYMFLC